MLVSLVTPITLFRGGLILPAIMPLCVVAYTFIEMVSCVVCVKMDMLFLYI